MNVDERIGQNVVVLRGDRSQQDLADAMRARGWKWSQATVWSVEKGERPLRLAEADDLADLLGIGPGPGRLLGTIGENSVHLAIRAVSAADTTLLDAIAAFENRKAELAIIADYTENPPDTYQAAEVTYWITRQVRDVTKDHDVEQDAQAAADMARARGEGHDPKKRPRPKDRPFTAAYKEARTRG